MLFFLVERVNFNADMNTFSKGLFTFVHISSLKLSERSVKDVV